MHKTSRISDPYVGLGCRQAAIGQFFPPFLTLDSHGGNTEHMKCNAAGNVSRSSTHELREEKKQAGSETAACGPPHEFRFVFSFTQAGKERRVAVCAPHTLAYPFLITHCRRQNKLQACRGYLFNGRHIPAVRVLLWHAERVNQRWLASHPLLVNKTILGIINTAHSEKKCSAA